MNDSLTRKFCETRYRWPIVATATALLALAAVLPQVDDYCDKRNSRNELADNLVRARETANTLPLFEKRATEVGGQLAALEVRTIDELRLTQYRNRIVDMVRDAGCQIRQFDVAAPTTRTWKQGDDPLKESVDPTLKSADTPFTLERRTMTLMVDGPMPAIHELMTRLQQERTVCHPHRVQLQSATAGGETVTLELELWLFALSRGKA
jgi:hypothetical protein